ncbi:MAG: peptidylprolyl isomerase/peptidyl-prolyl cis-trans isomerase B (cyclophilin B) [Verrucomicrobia bacterium]|jgi:peptidyl-prolyl cis-trans isomerase B (cyclophilin B)|nr:MAG: peptidylprolyl isomerase/peptidyl-prolyl cis-trans isomerase B (cyclophilin B) [Verrucomicrobiota bacterium]
MNPRLFFAAALFAALCSPLLAEDVVILQLEKKGSPLAPLVIELFEAEAPKHASNFKKLVAKGFYNKTSIHRILPNALVQMGDPISRQKNMVDLGTGGPGYTLAPEIRHKHTEAVVGMGRLPDKINPGRLSNGSQFYITLRALPELDGTQTVFGKITQGMDVLRELGNAPTDTNDAPVDRVVIRRATVVPKEKVATSTPPPRPSKLGWWSRLTGSIPKLF